MYNGPVQKVIAGLPKWTFSSIMWLMLGTLSLWKVDLNENEDQSTENRDC